MNLIRLINRATLHIFGYRSLLVWNLFAYFICTSCSSMQVSNGFKIPQESNSKQTNDKGDYNVNNTALKKSDYRLHKACATGSLNEVKTIFKKKGCIEQVLKFWRKKFSLNNLNAQETFGYTPLGLAILCCIENSPTKTNVNGINQTKTSIPSIYKKNGYQLNLKDTTTL